MGLNVSPSFIFGGDTGVDYAELKRRRKLADALKEQVVGGTPRNVPEGIAAIGKALIYKATDKKLSAKERKAREEARKAMAALLGGGTSPAGVQPDYTGGAPADLVARVMQQESGGNPNAVSPKGAVGTMQTMPGTLVDPGFGVRPASDPNDPAERERVGKDYLAAMLKRYNGDETRALVAYNWGPGNADKWDGDPAKLPEETRNYVRAILGGQQAPQQQPSTAAIMQVLNNPYATPEQRSIAHAMLAQSLQKPEQMTPYQQAQIDLRKQELEMRQNGGGETAKYSLTPQYFTDAAGNLKMMQLGSDGSTNVVDLPEGAAIQKGVQKMDLGTSYQWFNTITGEPIGEPIPKDLAGAEAAKVAGRTKGESQATAQIDLPGAEYEFNRVTGLIDSVIADPALPSITGMVQGRLPPLTQEGTNLMAKVDQLKGTAFLNAFQSLKGGGQITEIEGQKAEEAQARLNRAQSTEAYIAALKEMKDLVEEAYRDTTRKAGGAPAQPKPAAAPEVAPQSFIDDIGDPGGGITAQDVWDSMTPEERAAWAN